MGARWVDGAALLLAAVGLLFVLINAGLQSANTRLTREVVAGQERINEGLRLSQFNTIVVRSLAAMSLERDDEDLSWLLAQHGIRVQPSGDSVASGSTP